MGSSQTNYYNFPSFPPPPHPYSPPPPSPPPPPPPAAKPPSHSTPPPPPHLRPPPPHTRPPPPHIRPPPPPRVLPPPPPHVLPPPPPHVLPPPPPHVLPPPPPPPSSHSTVIIIVFVSLGGLFFLAFLSVALCCFIKKRKKKMVRETEIINVDEHLKVKEVIVPGPHGAQAVMLSIDDDVHIQEEIRKKENFGEGLGGKSAEGTASSIGKKKKKKMAQETDMVKVDENLKMEEAIVAGPWGAQAKAISIEDDVHIQEEIRKRKLDGGLHEKLAKGITSAIGKGKRIGKGKKMIQEAEKVKVDEHLKVKVKEAIVGGPHGAQAGVLSMDDDVRIQEEIRKHDEFGKGLLGH